MTKMTYLRAASLAGVCLGFAGCVSNTGTATTPAVAPSSAYDTAFSAAQGQLATQTPLTGSASYTGQVSVRTNANAADATEAVYGDLAMSVDFAPNVARPITATVSNIAGNVNGAATDIAGTLSTANAPTQINAVTATAVNIPGQGAITSTGMSVGLEGTLTDPTGTLSGDALMTLQGTMVGSDGASVFGSNSVAIKPATGPNVITGGTFYANKN